MHFGAQEIVIALVVVLILFGGRMLPRIARSIADARRELKGDSQA